MWPSAPPMIPALVREALVKVTAAPESRPETLTRPAPSIPGAKVPEADWTRLSLAAGASSISEPEMVCVVPCSVVPYSTQVVFGQLLAVLVRVSEPPPVTTNWRSCPSGMGPTTVSAPDCVAVIPDPTVSLASWAFIAMAAALSSPFV